MKTTFLAGSSENADLTFSHAGVSRKHLQIEYLSKDQLRLTDLDSTNGTFVNESEIATSFLHPTDSLRLGPYVVNVPQLFTDIRDLYLRHKTDLRTEFEDLKTLFAAFNKEKQKIEKSSSRKALYIKIATSILLIGGLLIFGDRIPANLRYPLIAGAGLLTAVLGVTDRSNNHRREKLDLLYARYENQLVCPKCKYPLIRRSFAYWETKKNCPKCNAKWVD